MAFNAKGNVAGSKNVAPKKDIGTITKLLYKPTLSRLCTFNPTMTPKAENTAQFSTNSSKNNGLTKLQIYPVNSTATKITDPDVINPLTIPASILPTCNANG